MGNPGLGQGELRVPSGKADRMLISKLGARVRLLRKPRGLAHVGVW